MTLKFFFLIIGFAFLIKGAGWLVDGGAALARRHRVSELAIGLTIVAFGTSMPEFVVNVYGAFKSHSDIVFGNVIGSNIFNLFAILGVAGIIAPIKVKSSTVWKEIPLSLFAAFLLFILSNNLLTRQNILSRIDGAVLLLFFCFFLWYVFKQLKNEELSSDSEIKNLSVLRIWVNIFAGLIFLIAGGRLVVINAVSIAEFLGMSETVVGLTIVAAGTSLPELATSVVAAIKQRSDIAVGNIIGSNIFNIFLILGVSAVIRPVDYSIKFNNHLYLLGIGTILLLVAMFTGKKKRLDRWESVILLLIYVVYTTLLIRKEIN